jgi:hypothetical protein
MSALKATRRQTKQQNRWQHDSLGALPDVALASHIEIGKREFDSSID